MNRVGKLAHCKISSGSILIVTNPLKLNMNRVINVSHYT